MAKIQLGTGSSSASSHRITQSSQTLNRRYVGRPSNLIIDEAAQAAAYDDNSANSVPSRLVNLRVHAADLQQLQQSEPDPQPPVTNTPQQVVPRVVELGSIDRTMPVDDINMNTLSQVVPPEDTIDQPTYEPPVSQEVAMSAFTTDAYTENQAFGYDNSEVQMTQGYTYGSMVPAVQSQYSDNSAMVEAPTELDTQSLAMSIAADYAAASFGASVNDNNPNYNSLSTPETSIDVIAQAASEAIAAIRTATDPAEVAEQVASLRAFAANIRETSTTPEMLELSDTIEKFVGVAMKSTKVQEEVEKRTAKPAESAKIAVKSSSSRASAAPKTALRTSTVKPSSANRATKAAAPKPRPVSRHTAKTATPRLVADEDQALRKALRSVAAMDDEPAASDKKFTRRAPVKAKGGRKRFALAFFCATVCVAAVVYFVGTNIPDISVKVAAMQTGIEAKYPSYVPRDFSLSDISSEDGKITLTFKGPEKASFTLSEEKSSWDSTALLRNYVEPTWQSNYTTTHEQGITVYIAGSNAAWVNGGILYKISTQSGNSLTNKQLRNIVTSL